MTRPRLVVFAKAPRPGLVKTRLSPPLSLEQAAALYREMLCDVLETSARIARRFDLEPVLAFHPADAAADLVAMTPAGFRLQRQTGRDLGEKMANAFAEADAAGAPWCLLRGSDSPGLAERQLEPAIQALERGDPLVLTPDQGGGYAMIGLTAPRSALFEVEMSTDDMLSKTLAVARQLDLRVVTTPPALDLDTAADLQTYLDAASYRAAPVPGSPRGDGFEDPSDPGRRTVEAIALLRSDGVL